MTTTKNLKQIIFLATMLLLAFALLFSAIPTKIATAEYKVAFSEVTVTNGDFNSSTTTALQSSPTGWTRVGSSTGKNGVISVNSDSFSSRANSSYALLSTQNPYKAYTDLDDHVLMINAKSSNTTNETNHIGYESNSISLESYSFYKFSVWTITQGNSSASIYLSGLDEEVANTNFESYTSSVWTEYRFFIATGIDAQSVKVELWLGTQNQDSLDAVFFDHVTATKLSENYFAEDAVANSRTNVIDLREYINSPILNPDFEGGFSGWTPVNPILYGDAKIVSIQNSESMTSLGLEYLGANLSANNNYALTLYSKDKATSIGYESSSFEVMPYETYKITIYAKVSSDLSGKARIVLKEGNEVSNFYGEDYSDYYEPSSTTIEVSSNSSNEILNNYNAYHFYIKGHELFKTSFTLQLWLGSTEEEAKGCVVFDDIKFEKISWQQYSNADTSNSQSVALSTISGSPSVTNGAFNTASNLNKDFSYPVTPSDWTISKEDATSKAGIINTYSPFYEANKSSYGNLANPGNPSSAGSVDSDVNNMLMLYNPSQTYLSTTSPEITTTVDSYQKITFDYKTVAESLNTKLLNVYVLDSDGNVIYADEGLYSSSWTTYTLMIKSYAYDNTIQLKLSLGSKDEPVNGYLFVDNVRFTKDESMTDELYAAYTETHKTLDFSVTNFNLISPNQTNGMYTAYRYTAQLVSGSNVYGGIIDGSDNIYEVSNSQSDSTLKYMPAFVANAQSEYYLTSKDSLSLSADEYYKFSVDIYTRWYTNYFTPNEDEEIYYGAIFALEGIEDRFENVVSNDEWTTYVMYVKLDEVTSVQLRFGILNESNDIQGQVFFDNFKFETVDETEYTQAINLSKNDDTMLVINSAKEEEEEEKKDDTDNETNSSMIWYIIPSVLLFAALVIALVAYFGKKVTIKKWERKKVAEYDRDATLHRDVVRKDAEKIRDEKVKELKKQVQDLQAEISALEQEHKETVKAQRKTADRSVTRDQEKDFKAYAQKHTKLENQLELLNNKIDSLNMPEYLLSIQRGLILEKVRKEKEEKDRVNKEKKQAKKQAKLENK